MRVLIQKVNYAKCLVAEKVVNEINHGMMLLVGFTPGDTEGTVLKMAKKIMNLRVFEDQNGKLNHAIKDVSGEILSISQFTLYADTSKGHRPSFSGSMNYHDALLLYELFNKVLSDNFQVAVKAGSYGHHMRLDIELDGPVTIWLEF